MMPAYVPIACGFHDELLSRATLQQACDIIYMDEAGRRRELRERIVDVYSKGDEEFLKVESGATVRLDMLVSVDGKELPGRTQGV